MGLIFNGNGDVIKAVDGSLTVEGLDIDDSSTNINAGIVTGTSANFTGNVSVGGVLTYEDVKNVDSVGIVTARAGLHVQDDSTFYGVTSGRNVVWDKSENSLEFKDYTYAKFGVDDDLTISSQNTLSLINNKTGELRIPSAGNIRLLKRHDTGSAFAAELANFKVDGAVELFNAGSKKFETTSSGVTVTGTVAATSYTGDGSNLTGITETTINNNADNRIITGSGTANTLEAESTLTFDGNNLKVKASTEGNSATLQLIADQGDDAPDNWRIMSAASDNALVFSSSESTERLRIDASGRVLIGTTTEGNAGSDDLTIATSGSTGITLRSGTSSNGNLYFSDGTSGDDEYRGSIQYQHASNKLIFATDAVERLTIDSTGALGLGITPKNNGGNYRQLQIGLGAHFYGRTDDTPIYLSSNAYYDGSNWKYTANTTCTQIVMGTNIQFKNAPSGTAGNTATLTERLRIDSTGRMTQNGTTSADTASALTLKNGQSGNDHTILELISDPGQYSMIYLGASDDRYKGQIRYKDNDHFMDLRTNGTDRLRITSAGKLLVGTTTEGSSGVDNLILYRNGNGGITIRNNANQNGNLFFSRGTSGTDEYKGYIQYQHAQDLMVFGTSNTERLRLTGGGQLIQYTTHTTGNSAHSNTSWYGDDASQYTIEIRDFNEMYAVKTVNTNNYDSIIYKREKMTNYCDIEFTMTSASDNSSGSFMHLGMIINGDGSDTHSNFDRLVFRSHGGSTSSNHIRIDKGGGGTGFTYQTSNLPVFFDGNERHYQIKIRGRRFSIYIDGSHVVTRYTDANLVRTHGYPGLSIYEASTVNPWIKVRDFKVTNHTPNTGVPGWETVFDTPASTNASSSFVIDNMDNPQTVELRFWRLRHSGGDTNTYMRLGWQGSWKTSGYYDIGQYHNQSGNWNASRGYSQGQACPFHYDFTGSTNYYSGCITIRRVTSGGNNTGFIYKCEHVVDYDSGNTQYHVLVNGQVTFGNTNPWTKIQLYTNTGTNFNYGSMQVLAQY